MTATATETRVPIDLWSSSSFAHGHPVEQYHWLQENAPVYWHEEPDGGRGFWAVTSAQLLKDASVRPKTFSSASGMTMYDLPPEVLEGLRNFLMFMDPPRHTGLRKLVNSEFTPRGAQRWAEPIDKVADSIIDSVCEKGECELMSEVAALLPTSVVTTLLGVDREQGIKLYELVEIMHSAQDTVTEEQRTVAREEMVAFGMALHAAKLATPDDSMASNLVHAELEGQELSALDFALFILLLVNAGEDTVRNLTGGAVITLLEHPEVLARLRDDTEALMPKAVEEFIRYQSPVTYQRRTATEDTHLGDAEIKRGDKVLLYYGAANRDPALISDPDAFIIDRDPNPHMGFGGGGPHFCLGAHIARLQIRAIMSRIVTRLPDLQLAGEPTWLASNFISGPTYVPLRFTPTPKRGL
ncbi:cytochrome P450 [Jatrophihabitans sp. GAS493]|uniref:cytochrome P450 n=1 Tax=Jatrophihabitans sp. GAS493 TaxID=1907575 RepID=UPI000BB73AD4|nr:cytochrome P450 [Jatrophihabitans sp. GAS493]SOD72162.1 cytochrome P450 [Jatrophihabitans sp. GAS493]